MPRKIRSNYMEKFKFVYNGRIFDSKHKCCEFYGICYRSVMSYQNRHKCTTEESITHFIELKKVKKSYSEIENGTVLKPVANFTI